MNLPMTLLAKLVESFQRPTENPFHGKVRELAPRTWTLDVSEPDRVRLQLECSGDRRMVTIREHADGTSFSAYSDVEFPGREIPPKLCSYLLKRNREIPFGAWMSLETKGYSTVLVRYHTDLRLLTPALFQRICEGLTDEIMYLDQFMDQHGLMSD